MIADILTKALVGPSSSRPGETDQLGDGYLEEVKPGPRVCWKERCPWLPRVWRRLPEQ
jgi:hypothetical protein